MLRQILNSNKKINNLELKIVFLNVTFETKERMTDRITLDLNRSESHVSRLLHQIRDHQDAINSLNEAVEFKDPEPASSVASGHTTSCLTDRTPVTRETFPCLDPNTLSRRDHKAGNNPIVTSVKSDTVASSFLKGVPHTLHLTGKLARPALQQQASIFRRRNLPIVILTRGATLMQF